jgi:hypothetical protein
MTITLEDYFGQWIDHPDATADIKMAADALLMKVNTLLDMAFEGGVDLLINPATQSYVSGKAYGGFRPQDCPQGAPKSSHKAGRAVDIYDPHGVLDEWCLKNTAKLKALGLYMEHPSATVSWCHLTDRPPASGRTVFHP